MDDAAARRGFLAFGVLCLAIALTLYLVRSGRTDAEGVRAPERRAPEAPAGALADGPGGGDPADAEARTEDLIARLGRLEGRLGEIEGAVAEANRLASDLDDVAQESEVTDILRAHRAAMKVAAVATLRNGTSAQAQTQATARIDEDHDGVGEYGGLREMSGVVPGRMERLLIPPVLSRVFQELGADGAAVRNGYRYRIFLPGFDGSGVGEPEEGFTRGMVDPDLAESTWCVYAWPDQAHPDMPTFFTNQSGDIFMTVDPRYAGEGNGPAPDAAFADAGTILGEVRRGEPAADGNTWTQTR